MSPSLSVPVVLDAEDVWDLSAENRSCMSLCMACMGFELELELLLESDVPEEALLSVPEGGGGGGIWPPMEMPDCCSAWVIACMKSSPSLLLCRWPPPCTWLLPEVPLVLLAWLMELMKFV